MLSAEGAVKVGLPQVVVGGEEDEASSIDGALQAGDGSGLISLAGDSGTIGVTLGRPAGLCDHGGLSACGLDRCEGVGSPGTSTTSCDAGVEEGVSVDRGVVGGFAELRVREDGTPCVNGHNVASVAGGAEEGACGVDGGDDLSNGSFTRVDEFVADADGVEVVPVTAGVGDDGLDLGVDLGDVVDTGEELHALCHGGRTDRVELVTVDTVHANKDVFSKCLEVIVDLGLGLAASVGVVWRIGQTVARRRAGAGSGRGSRGG